MNRAGRYITCVLWALLMFALPSQAPATLEVVDTIEFVPADNGRDPWGVAFDPSRGLAYVADLATPAMITVIDGADHTILAKIDLSGLYPHGIAYDQVTDRIFVANYGTDNVSVVDAGSAVEIDVVDVGDTPQDVCVNSVTGKIYVANMYDGTVSVIDGATNQVTATVDVGDYPYDICVNEVTNRVYTNTVRIRDS